THQPIDAASQRIDDLGLMSHHGGQIEFHLTDLDPAVLKPLLRLLIEMAGFKKGLAGNTANAKTGPPKFLFLLNNCDRFAKLCSPNRCDVSTRATTDYHQVEICHVCLLPNVPVRWSAELGSSCQSSSRSAQQGSVAVPEPNLLL